eukprot:GHRQ01024982.1.p2 GENE.GHRQ01024982.1~~GHRQ01024982.1.p2  ORF type:complete len:124 (-),score=24.96 GHRQ01024982.1:494-865(-)
MNPRLSFAAHAAYATAGLQGCSVHNGQDEDRCLRLSLGCCVQRVSKLPYKADEADEFERAWLALADIHIAGGKFDLAQVGMHTSRACSTGQACPAPSRSIACVHSNTLNHCRRHTSSPVHLRW